MPTAARRWALWFALLAILGGLVWRDQRSESTASLASAVAPVTRPQRTPTAAAPAASVAAPLPRPLVPREELVPRRSAAAPSVDLFAAHSWVPPPPAPPPVRSVPVPVPPPAGPALTYLGKRQDEQGWQVYLGRGDQTLIVRQGDNVEGGYRVEAIRPPTLTLSRGDQRHQIGIGDWE